MTNAFRTTNGEPRRTAVICTIGPASRAPRKLVELVEAGMDIARLHFSYADQKEHAVNIARLREAEAPPRVGKSECSRICLEPRSACCRNDSGGWELRPRSSASAGS